MQRLKNIALFQKKIFFTAIIFSIVLAIATGNLNMTGIYYFFLSPLMHYFIYEIRDPHEYYYYFNIGFDKIQLWGSTLLVAVLIFLLVALL